MKRVTIYILLLLQGIPVWAQHKPQSLMGRGAEAFPYPFANTYFISPRYDRTMYEGNQFFDSYYLRNVATVNGKNHMRFDIPIASTNRTNSRSTQWGLGDLSLRYTRILGNVKEVFYGAHCNLVMPTATYNTLGGGKWQAQVGAGAMHFRSSATGTASIAVEYRFSFAGDNNRGDVRQLAISPNADYWGKGWYAGYYATWMYDFESDKFDLPLDVEAGFNVLPMLVLAAEFKQPLIKDSGYLREFAVKLRYNIVSY